MCFYYKHVQLNNINFQTEASPGSWSIQCVIVWIKVAELAFRVLSEYLLDIYWVNQLFDATHEIAAEIQTQNGWQGRTVATPELCRSHLLNLHFWAKIYSSWSSETWLYLACKILMRPNLSYQLRAMRLSFLKEWNPGPWTLKTPYCNF